MALGAGLGVCSSGHVISRCMDCVYAYKVAYLGVSVFSSGADLTALVREAAILALREHMQLTMSPLQSNQSDCSITADSCVVSMQHFTTALKKIKPSVSQKVSITEVLGRIVRTLLPPCLTVPGSFTTSSFAVWTA